MNAKTVADGIYGLAVGDALGVPYEFMTREQIADSPCIGMTGNGTHDKPAGTWSDDTSMTLALMDGLCGFSENGYPGIMRNFCEWLGKGKYTVDGMFDVGITCRKAIFAFVSGKTPTECGGGGEYDNGNGSLMRILPAVLYSIEKYGKPDYGFISDISALTHRHEISKTACYIYALTVQSIINGEPFRDSVVKAAQAAGNGCNGVFDRMKTEAFFDLPEEQIKSSGYVVDTLEAAVWCVGVTSDFGDCVCRAVNLGKDTDTVAAVAGSLAGLLYGKDSIPAQWLGVLRGKEIINEIIDKFCNI